MAFFTGEYKFMGNIHSVSVYYASIDVNKFTKPIIVPQIIGYEIPPATIKSITERLNALLPATPFTYKRYNDGTLHKWRVDSPKILIEIRITNTVRLTIEYMGVPNYVFEAFLERVKKIIQGDTSETGPFVPPTGPAEPPPPTQSPKQESCKKRLKDEGIQDKGSFRKWALTNHPDKGGDVAKFQEINDCMDVVFPQGGRRKSRRKIRRSRKTRRRL